MNDGSMTYEMQLSAAAAFILEHDRFLVVSHIQPDGDAISSTCAVGWMLGQCGKSYTMVNEDTVPEKFGFLNLSASIVELNSLTSEMPFDAVIAVDCADFSRLGEAHTIFTESVQILNIDHHPTNDFFGNFHLIKDDASASVEILYDLIQSMSLSMDREVAACIYTGLLTDTGGFRYANTSPKVMRIASELLTYGVNGNDLAEKLLETVTYAHIQLLKQSLSTLSFSEDRRISWMCVTSDTIERTNATSVDLEGLVNYPRNIEGVEVGLLFKQSAPDQVKVSFRSAGKVDVAQIAKAYGGGGHIRAAGCTFKGSIDEAVNSIVNHIQKALVL